MHSGVYMFRTKYQCIYLESFLLIYQTMIHYKQSKACLVFSYFHQFLELVEEDANPWALQLCLLCHFVHCDIELVVFSVCNIIVWYNLKLKLKDHYTKTLFHDTTVHRLHWSFNSMVLDISKNPFMYSYLILFKSKPTHNSIILCNLCNKHMMLLNYSNPIAIPINDSS